MAAALKTFFSRIVRSSPSNFFSNVVHRSLPNFFSKEVQSRPPRLWVKFRDGGRPIPIDPSEATYVADLLKIIKEDFAPDLDLYSVGQLDLFKPDGKKLLNGDHLTSLSVAASHEMPLKVEPVSKKIYIRDVDENLRPLDSFTEEIIECEADIELIMEGIGSAFVKVSFPNKILTDFHDLEDGEKY
ncbi:unnamed protein product [Calypogeia fissa]